MPSLLTTVESLSGLTQSREASPPVKRAVFQQESYSLQLVVIHEHHVRVCGRVVLVTWGRMGVASLVCGDNAGRWLHWPKRCFGGLLDPAR